MPRSSPNFWLLASVHRDAFLLTPRPYLIAAWSWFRRKKVRARGQMAPLLAQSPNAYAVWLQKEDRGNPSFEDEGQNQTFIALIDIRAGQEHLSETLNSLAAEGVEALVIGASEAPTLADAVREINWNNKPWLMLLTPGDRIAPGTTDAYHAAIQNADEEELNLIYSDDDLLDTKGRRQNPHFKSDWNSELFSHHDYLTGACIIRAEQHQLDDLVTEPDWARQLAMRVTDQGGALHIHKMLHHRRHRSMPAMAQIPDRLDRDFPLVSIIIPTRNRVDLLSTCIRGIEETDYPHMEVIIVDNDSDDPETLVYLAGLDPARYKVLHYPGAFNYSAINNYAAARAEGKLLCLLNNDIEMIDSDWLKIMAVQAMREDVGAVGARLLYPDGRIQHAGVVTGVGNAAGHAHRFLWPEDEGYFQRHSLPQFISAVTAACLLVQKERFLAVGGLNETDFAVAFNDVDLCLRLNQRGWQSLYESRATLIHHESVSRGLDRDPVGAARFAKELAALQRLWKTDEVTDPYHHPDLSRATEQFVIRL